MDRSPIRKIFATRSSPSSASDLQSSQSESSADRYVYLRINPTTNSKKLPLVVQQNATVLNVTENGSGNRTHSFTKIFNQSSQLEVFVGSVWKRVTEFIDGKSSTILTYGISKSGKTHTMYGTIHEPGIVPHAIRLLFCAVRCSPEPWYKVSGDDLIVALNGKEQVAEEDFKREELDSYKSATSAYVRERFLASCDSQAFKSDDQEYPADGEVTSVWMSVVDVGPKEVCDMLDGNSLKKLSFRPDGSAYVPGLKFMHVTTALEAYQLLIGKRLLGIETQSGTSNIIFTIKLLKYQRKNAANTVSVSTISFCDISTCAVYDGYGLTEEQKKKEKNMCSTFGQLETYVKTVSLFDGKAFWPFWESPFTLLLRRPLRGQETITFLVTITEDWNVEYQTRYVLWISSMIKRHSLVLRYF